MKTDYVFGDRVKDNKTYLYKDGCVGVAHFDTKGNEGYYSATYTEGTLQEYVDSLGEANV